MSKHEQELATGDAAPGHCYGCGVSHEISDYLDGRPLVTRATLEADTQALADMRTLDDWAKEDDSRERREGPCYGVREPDRFYCTLSGDGFANLAGPFFGATPDEARAKAADWVRELRKVPT